ncbi:hypothetical protein MRX96_047773 [Rhipicephalus microplus]
MQPTLDASSHCGSKAVRELGSGKLSVNMTVEPRSCSIILCSTDETYRLRFVARLGERTSRRGQIGDSTSVLLHLYLGLKCVARVNGALVKLLLGPRKTQFITCNCPEDWLA